MSLRENILNLASENHWDCIGYDDSDILLELFKKWALECVEPEMVRMSNQEVMDAIHEAKTDIVQRIEESTSEEVAK